MKKLFSIFIVVIVMIAFSGCAKTSDESEVWESAVYTEDTEFGNGNKTIETEIKVGDNSVTFTLNTDKDNLADALIEHDLISGEDGPYGLYVKKANGMIADYNETKSFWSLSKDGEYSQTGVSDTLIEDGEHYELTYTK